MAKYLDQYGNELKESIKEQYKLSRNEQFDEYTKNLEEVHDAAIALYEAAHWSCKALNAMTQTKLWVRLRDALGIEHGSSRGVIEAELKARGKADPEIFYDDNGIPWHKDAYGDYIKVVNENKDLRKQIQERDNQIFYLRSISPFAR